VSAKRRANKESQMAAQEATNRIRVLHIVGDSRYGGIARIILGLGRVGQAQGWQVDVLTTDPVVQQALARQSIGIVNLDVIRREIRPLWDLAGLFRLSAFLRRERYDIVHTHTSKGGFVGRLAAWLAGAPTIVHTVHGFAFHEASPAWSRMAYTTLERMAARWCHRIVTVSEFHRGWAVDLGICPPRQIQAIPNGIVPLESRDREVVANLRRQLVPAEGELLLLSPTRLADDKGLAYLIEAVALLPHDAPGCRLIIAGEGPARPALERLAQERGVSDRVTFLGFRDDVGDLLAAADLVVLPSLREGLSISLLEAMAAGRPIIASSIGSHREVAWPSQMARLAPPADPKALAEAIEQLARDPEQRSRLAERARSLFEARYREDRMLGEYRQLYRSLLDGETKNRRLSKNRPENHGPEPSTCRASTVRSATPSDLDGIVEIHQRTFSHFFLTRLGASFLRRYYELVLNYRAGIVLVSERHGGLNGFVCGFADPAEFYRLMWRNRRAFAMPALAALLRRPSLAASVFQAVRRVQDSATECEAQHCELSSIAVTPEASGNGLGRKLLQAFLNESWSRQTQCVYLTTDAEANEAAKALYSAVGFRQWRCFLQRKGRWMNEYRYQRDAADQPVESQS
jgi:glycosyltransferase involved in cell wall biosynthesis/ribosomal protein S18 acetylase RimI-like enzyme